MLDQLAQDGGVHIVGNAKELSRGGAEGKY